MNSLKALAWLAAATLLTSAAFAQKTGFFITAGAGVAHLKIADFAVYNPVASIPGQPLGEALPAIEKTSRVSVARLTLGYAFNEHWDLRLAYADYGAGDVQLAFPVYPGMVFIVGPDIFERHEMKYDSASFTLLPTYTRALGGKLDLKIGAGLSYNHTSAHIETAFSSGAILPRPPATAHNYAGVSESSLGYTLLLGADCQVFPRFALGISANYTAMKAKVPASPWANRSKPRVRIDALGAELSATWHW